MSRPLTTEDLRTDRPPTREQVDAILARLTDLKLAEIAQKIDGMRNLVKTGTVRGISPEQALEMAVDEIHLSMVDKSLFNKIGT